MKRGRNYVARISQDQLDALEHPTLEDILMFVNGGEYTPFFLQHPKKFKDGSVEHLTRAGAKAYSKLVSMIYACARLTGADAEDIVETMDNIIDEE